ncbi:hypothetical protein [Accumulibacter sp.]|uniref:hypothetical protein n=1 Tax=Accumulibacter sp. TaxID=2053492 RepID=UPI0035B4B3F9
MGEWSEYFEDYPEENPANWVNGSFDPVGAKQVRAIEAQRQVVDQESAALQEKMFEMADAAKKAAKERDSGSK